MDIIRDTKPKKRKRSLIVAGVIVGFAALTFAVQQLPSAAPSVDRAVVWMDTVEQGTLVRQIRGPGTLVPEQARLITAVTNGRVERIELLPGAEVQPGDVHPRFDEIFDHAHVRARRTEGGDDFRLSHD